MDMGLLSSRRYVCGVEDSNVCVRVCPDENQNKKDLGPVGSSQLVACEQGDAACLGCLALTCCTRADSL